MDKPVTLEQQIKCVARELKMREIMYPRWVSHGRMDQEKADWELAQMRAVMKTLKALEANQQLEDLDNPTAEEEVGQTRQSTLEEGSAQLNDRYWNNP